MLDTTTREHAQLICKHCSGFFSPRAGSGGRPQRFCSTDCRQAFHTDAQRGQRSPNVVALPAVIDRGNEKQAKANPEPPEGKFDWVDDNSIVLNHQPAIAIYLSPGGYLVIRQERAWDEESDTIITIAPESIDTFIDKITDVVGIQTFGGKP